MDILKAERKKKQDLLHFQVLLYASQNVKDKGGLGFFLRITLEFRELF